MKPEIISPAISFLGPVLVLDRKHKKIYKDRCLVEMTGKEWEILLFLLDHPGTPQSTKGIYEQVWKAPYLPSDQNTVMVHILHLRRKLEADPGKPRLIRTVWGKGYQIGSCSRAYPGL